MTILSINVGSSSARIGLHDTLDGTTLVSHHHTSSSGSYDIPRCLDDIAKDQPVAAICHRIVHAGPDCTKTRRIDDAAERMITSVQQLAPLHNPAALRWYRVSQKRFPDAPQVAVFDTGLYTGLPKRAAAYAIPPELAVKRLGFHGLAHRCMQAAVKTLDPKAFPEKRIISLQLGSGCSVTASLGCQVVDTSMGYTPLEGLMMGTRSGDLDPGLILHLLSQKGRTPEALEVLLSKQSGLLGVSGESGDVRDLLASGSDSAALAIDMFCYRARKYIGAFAAALGGVDHILFGGGIGENQPVIRGGILDGLGFLGVALDPARNEAAIGTTSLVSSDTSQVRLDVVNVDENRLMAKDTIAFLANE